MIKIGDFAKICNVSTQTLRYYDSEGILKADVVDFSSGYRFYSIEAVEKYKKIVFYKNLGFSLEEIKRIQSATKEELRGILQKQKDTLANSMGKLKSQLKEIDELCDDSSKGPALLDTLLLPFEDDAAVVGKWQLCGKLLDENDLTRIENIDEPAVDKEIIFMPGGAVAWKYFWTKGTLYRISSKYSFAIPNLYSTVEENGIRFMIVQFMIDECIDSGEDTLTLLYRQIDTVAYTDYTIRANVDNTDVPFVEDESVRGEWVVTDFVRKISDFDPNKKNFEDHYLYTRGINFLPRGMCTKIVRVGDGALQNLTLKYTKGAVLNNRDMTAEEYQIKVIDGKEFLFVQHKSGDYYYGGMTPYLYVFVRKG